MTERTRGKGVGEILGENKKEMCRRAYHNLERKRKNAKLLW